MSEITDESFKPGKMAAPAGTPGWALTIAFLSSNILIALGVFYVSISGDIKTYLGNRKEIELAAIAASQERTRQYCESLLATMGTGSLEGTELFRAVGLFLAEQAEVRRRVTGLLEENKVLQHRLEICQSKIPTK